MSVPMKESGVEWLGEVPAHWDVVRGSTVFVECRAKNDPLVSENYLSLMANIGIIPYEEKGDVGNKKPEDVRKCKLVEPGDFVLNSMNYAIGSYGVSRYSGVCSPVYVVMKHKPEKADPRFLDLILSNPSYQNYAQSFGTGILDHRRAIGWGEIKVIRVPLPPLDEQAEIAAWTISRRDRIDTLIAKKTRFIELLRQKRQAMITHAVSKGLDRGVAMNDSGVEWLGKVPAHWDVVRGSAVFVESKAKNDPLVSENYLSLMANIGIIPYEEKGDVGNKKPEDVRKCKLVEPGDFVLNSMNYAIGSYGVSSYSGVCSPVYVVMKHRPEVADPKFLDLILSNPSYQKYTQSFGTGILDHRRAIGWDEIKVIRVPLPPLDEQAEIAAWTISRRSRVDTLIYKTERSIELLREHRTALITAAVTGKIDMRPAA